MGTIFRDLTGQLIETWQGFDESGKCHVCGGLPDAFWVGEKTLLVSIRSA